MSDRVYVGLDIADFRGYQAGKPISRVTLLYDDENGFTAGDDSGLEVIAECYFATQEMVDAALDILRGQAYRPFEAMAAGIDPAAELGDAVTVNGIYAPLIRRTDSGYGYPDIEALGEEELEDDEQCEGYLAREVKRKVTLGASYHGVSITRANGIEVTQYDAEGNAQSRAKLNGDVFAMYDDDGTARIYFDPETGRYKFYGDLDISGGSINLDGGSIVWGDDKPMFKDDYDYLHKSYIGPTIIRSPTIEANEFNVQPSDEEDYTGSFNIYGMQLAEYYHMLAIAYQGYNNETTPYVDIYSPDGADLRFNYGNQGVSPIQFFGSVDFTNAKPIGLYLEFS